MPTNRETLLCRYHYDPLDRLATCTLSTQVSTQRFYQKSRLATEIQGLVQHSIFQHDDQLLAQQQRQGGTVETTLLATDQQRSVLNALDATPPHSFAYTPYGHRPPEGGLLSLLGFNGERPDPVTGHYVLGNGYRAFNPVLMRFNSPDSWSPFGKGGINAYASFDSDPVNKTDPSGHFSFYTAIKSLIISNKWKKRTFFNLKKMDDVPFRKVASLLNGGDLTALALSSKSMHTKVTSNVKPMNLLDNAHDLSTAEYINKLREISLGQEHGYLPSQVIENKQYSTIANGIPKNDLEPRHSYLHDQYSNAFENKRSKRIAWENERVRRLEKEQKRAAYGEDWHSDTSYDSD